MNFVAIFCPNCGTCVNEPEEILNDVGVTLCWWCKRRHSFEQVVICRNLVHLTEQQRMAGALAHTRAGLLALRERMRVPVFRSFGATVMESGGGWVQMVVDEDTHSYPAHGVHVTVTQGGLPPYRRRST